MKSSLLIKFDLILYLFTPGMSKHLKSIVSNCFRFVLEPPAAGLFLHFYCFTQILFLPKWFFFLFTLWVNGFWFGSSINPVLQDYSQDETLQVRCSFTSSAHLTINSRSDHEILWKKTETHIRAASTIKYLTEQNE